jgi:hypothetical protein
VRRAVWLLPRASGPSVHHAARRPPAPQQRSCVAGTPRRWGQASRGGTMDMSRSARPRAFRRGTGGTTCVRTEACRWALIRAPLAWVALQEERSTRHTCTRARAGDECLTPARDPGVMKQLSAHLRPSKNAASAGDASRITTPTPSPSAMPPAVSVKVTELRLRTAPRPQPRALSKSLFNARPDDLHAQICGIARLRAHRAPVDPGSTSAGSSLF